jgi:hypothetical protein
MQHVDGALSRASDVIYRRFGYPAVYTDRDAVQTPCQVLIEQDLDRYGTTAVVNKRTAVVQVRRFEVPHAPRQGEAFAVAGRTWVVDTLQGSDPFEHRVFVA